MATQRVKLELTWIGKENRPRLDPRILLSDEVGEKRSLLFYCGAFRGKTDIFPNLTVKMMPKAVLKKCEWGHDDYSLEIGEMSPPIPVPQGEFTEPVLCGSPRKKKEQGGQADLS